MEEKIKNKLNPGDHVLTSAVGFPTTVNPIFQNNLIPVFVDCEIGTYNPMLPKDSADRVKMDLDKAKEFQAALEEIGDIFWETKK